MSRNDIEHFKYVQMQTSSSNQLKSSRFINMCVANWFLHLYVFSLIPLLYAQNRQLHGENSMVAWAVVAFAVGMIIPGPFGAHMMECCSRKEVFLKAMVVIGIFPTIGYVYAPHPAWLIVLHGIQGMAFGVAQTALGTTLVNDVLKSKQRDKGDVIYAWAGRLGIPLGLFLGFLLLHFMTIESAFWWSLVTCMLSFLVVAQTQVPLKAPVKVPLITFDRFFLPKSFPLMLSMFAAPWLMGRVVGNGVAAAACLCMALGAFLAFVEQILLRKRLGQQVAVCAGYVLLLLSCILLAMPGVYSTYMVYVLIGFAVGTVSSRHLIEWILKAEHCQRGTAQSTYMLSWRLSFALGFVISTLCGMQTIAYDVTVVALSMVIYLLFRFRTKAA